MYKIILFKKGIFWKSEAYLISSPANSYIVHAGSIGLKKNTAMRRTIKKINSIVPEEYFYRKP